MNSKAQQDNSNRQNQSPGTKTGRHHGEAKRKNKLRRICLCIKIGFELNAVAIVVIFPLVDLTKMNIECLYLYFRKKNEYTHTLYSLLTCINTQVSCIQN